MELGTYRGRVELAWSDVLAALADKDLPAEVRTAAANVAFSYFGEFQDTRAKIYTAGMSGSTYPVTAQAWVAEATNAIDTVLQLSRTTGEATAAIALASTQAERNAAYGSVGALIFSLAIATATMLIVTFQVVRPLGRLTSVARELAAGELNAVIPCQGWTDELGRLGNSVAVLQEGMLEKVALEREQEQLRSQRIGEQ